MGGEQAKIIQNKSIVDKNPQQQTIQERSQFNQFPQQQMEKSNKIFLLITNNQRKLDSAQQLTQYYQKNQQFFNKLYDWMCLLFKKDQFIFDEWIQIVEILIQEPSMYSSLLAKQQKKQSRVEIIFQMCISETQIENDEMLDNDKLQCYFDIILDLLHESGLKAAQLYFNRIVDDTLRDKHRISYILSKINMHLPMLDEALRIIFLQLFIDSHQSLQLLKLRQSSDIIKDQHLLLLKLSDQIYSQNKNSLTLLYSNVSSGSSFNRLAWNVLGYDGPTLMVVLLKRKQIFRNNEYSMIFGAFNNIPWTDGLKYQGDSGNQLFSISPTFRQYTTHSSKGGNNYAYLNTKKIDRSKYKVGLGFGGSNCNSTYRIWIDDDIESNSSIYPSDDSFQTGYIVGEVEGRVEIDRIEIWGLGGEQALQKQEEYRIHKQEELERMKKVDKKQFFSSFDQEMFFSKTFSHRDQVREDVQDIHKYCQEKEEKDQK